MGQLRLVAACAVLALAGSALQGAAAAAPDSARSRALTPSLFAELSSGIALVRSYNCKNKPIDEGTGFLIGSSVVMTARHVIRGTCGVNVLLGGRWFSVDHLASWHSEGSKDVDTPDVATLKLSRAAPGHVFSIATRPVAKGANLAALGHPLGNDISLTQGHVVAKANFRRVPVLAIRLLAAEGASGSPLVDGHGNVVGIVQIALGSRDVLGQRTSGVIVGIDLPSWWPKVRKRLCEVYPAGGIPVCVGGGETHPPARTDPPDPPAPTVGTRDTPFPLGQAGAVPGGPFRAGTWKITVNSVNPDAWQVGPENMFNTPPASGYVDYTVNLTVRYDGPKPATIDQLGDFLATVGQSGIAYGLLQGCGVTPAPRLTDYYVVFPRATFNLNQCWQVQQSDVSSLEMYWTNHSTGPFWALH